MTITTVILSMAARSTGVRADEVHGLETRQVVNCLARLARAGAVYRVKLDAKNVRFFKHVGLRDAFIKKSDAALSVDPHRRAYVKPHTVSARWPEDAVAIVPKGLVIQHGPSHPPRFEEIEFPFVHGGLRCA